MRLRRKGGAEGGEEGPGWTLVLEMYFTLAIVAELGSADQALVLPPKARLSVVRGVKLTRWRIGMTCDHGPHICAHTNGYGRPCAQEQGLLLGGRPQAPRDSLCPNIILDSEYRTFP